MAVDFGLMLRPADIQQEEKLEGTSGMIVGKDKRPLLENLFFTKNQKPFIKSGPFLPKTMKYLSYFLKLRILCNNGLKEIILELEGPPFYPSA